MPLAPSEFDRLAANPDHEMLCRAVFEKAHWRWSDETLRNTITTPERVVLAVEMFFAETCNGGLVQYLMNESGELANHLPEALLQVGLRSYAELAQDLLNLFPKPLPSDSGERFDVIDPVADDDAFEDIDEAFFELYHGDDSESVRRQLHRYVLANRNDFLRIRSST